MSNTGVLVLGSSGMLGRYVTKYLSMSSLFFTKGVGRKEFDVLRDPISKIKKICENIEKKEIVIVNCIGVIPQTGRLKDREYFEVNSLFPQKLSVLCENLRYKLIHITTDCVFTGSKGGYTEISDHDEVGRYGLSKSMGEPKNCTVIRTSIIGEDIRQRSLLEWVRSMNGKSAKGYDNHYWNGMTCLQLAKIIYDIITRSRYWKGVRHLFSNTVSKHDLIKDIARVYGWNIDLVRFETSETVDKTLGSIYKKEFDILNLFDQIQEMKDFDVLN